MVYIQKLVLALASTIALTQATGSGGASGGSAGSSKCNPLSSSSCPADQALATDLVEDFSKNSSHFETVTGGSGVSFEDDGLSLKLSKRLENPTLKSKFYIMFGRVEAHIQAANGTGIVSSFFLQSDDLDEVDIEFLGGDDTQFQSNFFSKGDTTTYDRGQYHQVEGDSPQSSFHNYTIDWTEKECVWYLNGNAVRTLKNPSSEGYPQSPMYILTGIWAGGDSSNQQGTIEWAGGRTDYSKAPFTMKINKLIVNDYSTGSEYSYGDQSGDWTSIKAKDGKVNGRVKDVDYEGGDGSSSSSSDSSSATSSGSSSSTSGSSKSSESAGSDSSKASATSASGSSENSGAASTSLAADATTADSGSDSSSTSGSDSGSDSSSTSGSDSGSDSGSGSGGSGTGSSGSDSASSGTGSSSDSKSSSSSDSGSVSSQTSSGSSTLTINSILIVACVFTFLQVR